MKEFSHPGGAVKTHIDINHVINTTVTIARNEWKYVSDLDLNLAEDLPLVFADAQLMGQVLLNMVVNAAHSIEEREDLGEEEKGLITIETASAADEAIIRITDTGNGIPQKIIKRIFDPFYTTKEVGKGSGQGLAIAYSAIVDQHKGAIDVISEVGEGTTFTIRLPINDPDADKDLPENDTV